MADKPAEKPKREVGDALGMVETRGLVGMVEAASAASTMPTRPRVSTMPRASPTSRFGFSAAHGLSAIVADTLADWGWGSGLGTGRGAGGWL